MRRRLVLLTLTIAAALVTATFGGAFSGAQTATKCYSHADARYMTNGAYPYCVNNTPSATLPR
jgi:alanine dehydrogenase